MGCRVSETDSEPDAETHGEVLIFTSEPVPEFKAVVVVGFCSMTEGITSTDPEICKESLIDILISYCAKYGSHICEGADSCPTVIFIIGIYQFRTEIEALERKILLADEELVTVSDCESQRIVVVLVISRGDEAGAYLAALMMLRKSTFIGELRASAEPGKEGDLEGVQIVWLSRLWRHGCMGRVNRHPSQAEDKQEKFLHLISGFRL